VTTGPRREAPRAWHPEPAATGATVRLSPEESAHLVRSRRLGAGDAVVLFDGRGGSFAARVVVPDPKGTEVRIEGSAPDREPIRPIVLAASPPEGSRADALVSGLAELGCTRFVPLLCERTPPGLRDRVLARAERWRRLTVEAAKVNGRSRLLVVEAPEDFAAALARAAGGPPILLHPHPAPGRGAPPALGALLDEEGSLPPLWIGPEGGFSPAEVDRALSAGARIARLGSTILRVETAAMAAAAVAASA
jgi:16S rRNA (uracil1498-N3)-methyltransferase